MGDVFVAMNLATTVFGLFSGASFERSSNHYALGTFAAAGRGVILILILAISLTANAQVFTTLHSFTATRYSVNSDGASPSGDLVILSNRLYGVTRSGGASGVGVIFGINSDGSGFTKLHDFITGLGWTNNDGLWPVGGLAVASNVLYGTAYAGGLYNSGTLFRLNIDGTGFTNLHNFGGPQDGTSPNGNLIISEDNIFGVTQSGGSNYNGTVFAIKTDGSGYKVLHGFSNGEDGGHPYAAVTLFSNVLYGMTTDGGAAASGVIFRIGTDGSDFSVLRSFPNGNSFPIPNNEGAWPKGGLAASAGILFGTAVYGGTNEHGTVFCIRTNGNDFAVIHTFTALSNGSNNDGSRPYCTPALSGSKIFATASDGGDAGNGIVFQSNTDGSGFCALHSFTAESDVFTNSDGAMPQSAVILSGNHLFGTTGAGGSGGSGTIFSILLLPTLSLAQTRDKMIVSWPTNAVGFALQSMTNLSSAETWSPVPAVPAVVGSSYVVTNVISEQNQFFRLITSETNGSP